GRCGSIPSRPCAANESLFTAEGAARHSRNQTMKGGGVTGGGVDTASAREEGIGCSMTGSTSKEDAVQLFLTRHASRILGVLAGFDRLVFRGTLRNIAFVAGMEKFLSLRRVLLKDFSRFAQEATGALKSTSLEAAERLGRPVVYLPSGKTDKEKYAR